MKFKELLAKKLIVFDGAMGTMLQSKDINIGIELPELLNFKIPKMIQEIHSQYLDAGAQIITTNTFGANPFKLKGTSYSVEVVIAKAVDNAREASLGTSALIALGVGPLGEFLEPVGTLSFQQAYDAFKTQVIQGEASGVDLILIETMTSLLEAKAAILAAKENTNLPVVCTMSFAENQRTFLGCSLEAMVLVFQGLGVTALGVNCSLGPRELEPIVNRILEIASIPVMVQPNAGLPQKNNGKMIYNLSPGEFANFGEKFAKQGVAILGGCCGTDYRHIKALAKITGIFSPPVNKAKPLRAICSSRNALVLQGIKTVGQVCLEQSNLDRILDEALDQTELGADLIDLDIRVGQDSTGILKAIKTIQSMVHVPLQIPLTDPEVLERALRIYDGKAMVKVLLEHREALERSLLTIKKYGTSLVIQVEDRNAQLLSEESLFELVGGLLKLVHDYVAKDDVYIACPFQANSLMESFNKKFGMELIYQTKGIGKEPFNVVLGYPN